MEANKNPKDEESEEEEEQSEPTMRKPYRPPHIIQQQKQDKAKQEPKQDDSEEEEEEGGQVTQKAKPRPQQITQPQKEEQKKPQVDDDDEEEEEEEGGVTQKRPSAAVQKTEEEKTQTAGVVSNLQQESMDPVQFYKEKRLICKDIKNLFKEEFSKNPDLAIAKATRNQIIHITKDTKAKSFRDDQTDFTHDYIETNSHNFTRLESIKELGRGGESLIYRVYPYVPLEIVAKVPLPGEEEGSSEMFEGLLMEDHLLKMITNDEYICNVMEEIIEYNPDTKQIIGLICIVECATNDLSKIVKIWKNPQMAQQKVEYYSDAKLTYFCLKAIESLCYLQSLDVYFGDMKPENLLVFRNYKVKLGDFGVSMKLDPNEESYYLKGLTKEYSLKSMSSKFINDDEVTKRELLDNDNYSLWKTFNKINDLLKDQISDKGYFPLMLEDLKDYKGDLSKTLDKWQKKIAFDENYINTLCQALFDEDKFSAIIQALRFSQYRHTVEYCVHMQVKSERVLMKTEQASPIDEDEAFKSYVPPKLSHDEELFGKEIADDKDMVARLDPGMKETIIWLLKSYHINTEATFGESIKKTLGKLFDIPLTKTDQSVIDEYNKSKKSAKIKGNILTFDSINGLLTDREDREPDLSLIIKDYKEEFRHFCLFNIQAYIIERYQKDTGVQNDFSKKVYHILFWLKEMNEIDLWFEVLYFLEISSVKGHMSGDFEWKCIQEAIDYSLKNQNIKKDEVYSMITLFNKANWNRYERATRDYSPTKKKQLEDTTSFFKQGMENAQKYQKQLQASEWKLAHGLYNFLMKEIDKDNKIVYLEKQREILSNILGEANIDMNRNAYQLYQEYREKEPKKALFFLEKAVQFAINKVDKIFWMLELIDYTKDDQKKQIKALQGFQTQNPTIEAIALKFFANPYLQTIDRKIEAINEMKKSPAFQLKNKQLFYDREEIMIGLIMFIGCTRQEAIDFNKQFTDISAQRKDWAESCNKIEKHIRYLIQAQRDNNLQEAIKKLSPEIKQIPVGKGYEKIKFEEGVKVYLCDDSLTKKSGEVQCNQEIVKTMKQQCQKNEVYGNDSGQFLICKKCLQAVLAQEKFILNLTD